MQQTEIKDFALPEMRVDESTGGSIDERFERFHKLNPWIYEKLVHYARILKNTGNHKVGIALAYERLRWDFKVSTFGDDRYKLNNDFQSRYARLIMQNEPDLAGIFNIRKLRSE